MSCIGQGTEGLILVRLVFAVLVCAPVTLNPDYCELKVLYFRKYDIKVKFTDSLIYVVEYGAFCLMEFGSNI